ncbi:MAG: 4Fe-4S dicluster domain-containing protein [Clostridia bacterium]|nr:4Fe-4S dicluster domain-containing protein [Clostridia bacterium]
MQKITEDLARRRAAELMRAGEISCLLGWKKGEFDYDVEPTVFYTPEEVERELVCNVFSAANLSKYLISLTRKAEGRVGILLKPCDSFSFNQLLTEHRFDRERVYALGLPCEGTVDTFLLKERVGEGIYSIKIKDGALEVETLSGEVKEIPLSEVYAERCLVCKSRRPVAYDEMLGEVTPDADEDRFAQVEKLESMTAEERYAFWQGELSRCIRCNACRNVCPACSCERCVFDNPTSGVETKAPSEDSFEEKMFHIIRAFHVAGRCTDCGECSRVCPERIPLHLLNRKFIKDINSFYGDYTAGAEVGSRAPLVSYTKDDPEPGQGGQK